MRPHIRLLIDWLVDCLLKFPISLFRLNETAMYPLWLKKQLKPKYQEEMFRNICSLSVQLLDLK